MSLQILSSERTHAVACLNAAFRTSCLFHGQVIVPQAAPDPAHWLRHSVFADVVSSAVFFASCPLPPYVPLCEGFWTQTKCLLQVGFLRPLSEGTSASLELPSTLCSFAVVSEGAVWYESLPRASSSVDRPRAPLGPDLLGILCRIPTSTRCRTQCRAAPLNILKGVKK